MRFYIIDDDLSIQRILKNIIEMKNLGEVIGTTGNSQEAIDTIVAEEPDIVMIDLLLPEIDGIEIIKKIREKNVKTHFIMVSEVFAKDMVAKAYDVGVEYFINKPINVLEATTIINNVTEKIKMNNIIKSFESAINKLGTYQKTEDHEATPISRDLVIEKLNRLGVTGVGKIDIANIIIYIIENDKKDSFYLDNMSDYYQYISEKYKKEKDLAVKPQTIKQRIRRSLKDALNTIANIGLEDYYDPIFEKYASNLFKFYEVRRQMNYLDGKTDKEGKIDIKRFISGLIISINQELH